MLAPKSAMIQLADDHSLENKNLEENEETGESSENERSDESDPLIDSNKENKIKHEVSSVILARKEAKKRSFSFEISKKYGKRIGIYLLAIGISILVAYLVAPLLHVPMEYIIVPLCSSIAGTMLSSKVNKLIDSATFFAPRVLLDENSIILRNAENRIAELKMLDEKNGNDNFSPIIKELEKNVYICQGLDEGGSRHYINLFMADIKLLMRIPCRSASELYLSYLSQDDMEIRRRFILRQAKNLLAPYNLASRLLLSRFITEIMSKILPLPVPGYQDPRRVKPILLNGPPGIGKTYLVKRIAQIFGVPLCVINMGKENLDTLQGMQLASSATGTTPVAGLILKALTNEHTNPSGCSDIIVLLDEVDKAVVQNNEGVSEPTAKFIAFLHHFLQTDISTIDDKGYNIKIKINNVYIVCTSNRNFLLDKFIEEKTRQSLADRVDLINMPDLTRKAKIDILQKIWKDRLLADETLTSPQKAIQKAIVEKLLHVIIHNIAADVKPKPISTVLTVSASVASTALAADPKATSKTAISTDTSNPLTSIASPSLLPTTTRPAVALQEQTGLRNAIEQLERLYSDYYILLKKRPGAKSMANIIESYNRGIEKPRNNAVPDYVSLRIRDDSGSLQPLLRRGHGVVNPLIFSHTSGSTPRQSGMPLDQPRARRSVKIMDT